MLTTVIGCTIYLAGIISVIFVNAYFGWKLEEEGSAIVFVAMFWFLFYPLVLVGSLYLKVEELGEAHRAQRKTTSSHCSNQRSSSTVRNWGRGSRKNYYRPPW